MAEDTENKHEQHAANHAGFSRKRRAEFISHPNTLKEKVGSGGLSEEILQKAQALLENNTVDFQPLGEMYLDALMKGITFARSPGEVGDSESIISAMIYPAMQLKANGGMFHYPLVTAIGGRFVQFLEVINIVDVDVIEIALAFHTALRAVIHGKITGTGGRQGEDLIKALNQACARYFEKHESNQDKETQTYSFDL